MKIAFIGWEGAYSYKEIGGMNAYVLRLAENLLSSKAKVSLFYLSKTSGESEIYRGIEIEYFNTFDENLKHRLTEFDHTITIYFHRKDRSKWKDIRLQLKHVKHHLVISAWPDSFFKRNLRMIEINMMKYSGYHLCMSPRISKLSSFFGNKSEVVYPPVPISFYKDKSRENYHKLRIAFMGRLDPGKGALEAMNFFRCIRSQVHDFEVSIYGYAWESEESIRVKSEICDSDIHLVESKLCESPMEAESQVRGIFANIDILYLPYRSLQSTIDSPLVMLEGMASGCLVLTKDIGDLKEIYGSNVTVVDDILDYSLLLKKLKWVKDNLQSERERLFKQSKNFSTENSSEVLLSLLQK